MDCHLLEVLSLLPTVLGIQISSASYKNSYRKFRVCSIRSHILVNGCWPFGQHIDTLKDCIICKMVQRTLDFALLRWGSNKVLFVKSFFCRWSPKSLSIVNQSLSIFGLFMKTFLHLQALFAVLRLSLFCSVMFSWLTVWTQNLVQAFFILKPLTTQKCKRFRKVNSKKPKRL